MSMILRPVLRPVMLQAVCALATAAALLIAPAAQAQVQRPEMILWPEASADPREISGIELSADGRELWAVSDRGLLIHATITRTAAGAISGITAPVVGRLMPQPGDGPGPGDAEGITILRDGRLAVAFENPHRVAIYNRNGSAAETITSPAVFASFPGETGPEAIIATRDGALIVAMESLPRGATHIPLYRYADGQWGQIDGPPVERNFGPVGLDTDDQGRIYLLERQYRRPASFSTLLRRFTLTASGAYNVETLLRTQTGEFGNFEGVSIWRAADGGLRATLVADDNGTRLLPRGLAEFRIPN